MSTHLASLHPCCLGMVYQHQKSPQLYLPKLPVQLLFNLEQPHHVCAPCGEGGRFQKHSLTSEKGSNTSTPTTRSEAVQDWAVADVQEFIPQGFEHVVSRPCPYHSIRIDFLPSTSCLLTHPSLPALALLLSSSLSSRWC